MFEHTSDPAERLPNDARYRVHQPTDNFRLLTQPERIRIHELLASAGFNVNTQLWESPILNVAVGNLMVPGVDCLLKLGADPDIKGSTPNSSAREIAREFLEQVPEPPGIRPIAEMLGLDPARVLAERDARPAPEPQPMPDLANSLELAGDDARRQARKEIGHDNLFWGLMRGSELARQYYERASRMDFKRFREEMAERLLAGEDRIQGPALVLDAVSRGMMNMALVEAELRRREVINGAFLLLVLLKAGYAADLLTRFGGNVERVIHELERSI